MHLARRDTCLGAFEMYTYSLYFSIMTIAIGFIGFGDISATKFNLEQIVCSVIMLLTAMVWGYLIGVLRLASPAAHVQVFRNELSQPNTAMPHCIKRRAALDCASSSTRPST